MPITLSACRLLNLLSTPENGDGTFVQTASKILPDYMASHLKRQYSFINGNLPDECEANIQHYNWHEKHGKKGVRMANIAY
jgi:hypothetical protein